MKSILILNCVCLSREQEVTDVPRGQRSSSPALCLEAGVESHQEGVIGGLLKHMLLCLDPVYVLQHNTQHTTHTVQHTHT